MLKEIYLILLPPNINSTIKLNIGSALVDSSNIFSIFFLARNACDNIEFIQIQLKSFPDHLFIK